MLEWHSDADIKFLGSEDAQKALSACEVSLMLSEWPEFTYKRFLLSDGRVAWLICHGSTNRLMCTYLAPFGSVFDEEYVSRFDMASSVKPDGWRTKALDGLYGGAAINQRNSSNLIRDHRRLKCAIGDFVVMQLPAPEDNPTSNPCLLMRVASLTDDGLVATVDTGDGGAPIPTSACRKAAGWRHVTGWPNAMQVLWDKRRLRWGAYWSLTVNAGRMENKMRLDGVKRESAGTPKVATRARRSGAQQAPQVPTGQYVIYQFKTTSRLGKVATSRPDGTPETMWLMREYEETNQPDPCPPEAERVPQHHVMAAAAMFAEDYTLWRSKDALLAELERRSL